MSKKPSIRNSDLLKLKALYRYSDKYEISIQFWPASTAIYICKDGVELAYFGGSFDSAIGNGLKYLNRITRTKPQTLNNHE